MSYCRVYNLEGNCCMILQHHYHKISLHTLLHSWFTSLKNYNKVLTTMRIRAITWTRNTIPSIINNAISVSTSTLNKVNTLPNIKLNQTHTVAIITISDSVLRAISTLDFTKLQRTWYPVITSSIVWFTW